MIETSPGGRGAEVRVGDLTIFLVSFLILGCELASPQIDPVSKAT